MAAIVHHATVHDSSETVGTGSVIVVYGTGTAQQQYGRYCIIATATVFHVHGSGLHFGAIGKGHTFLQHHVLESVFTFGVFRLHGLRPHKKK